MNIQTAAVFDLSFASENFEEKGVDSTRSFLFGKTGRTWSGFFSDWKATFFASDELKGLGLSERWSRLANAPITLKSVKSGHDNGYYFASKLTEKTNSLFETIKEMNQTKNLDTYQSLEFSRVSAHYCENYFTSRLKWVTAFLPSRKAGLDNFVRTIVHFENELKGVFNKEIRTRPLTDVEELEKMMPQFIELSQRYSKMNNNPVNSLEKSIKECCDEICERFAQFKERLSDVQAGHKESIKEARSLQYFILDKIDTYEQLVFMEKDLRLHNDW